MERTQASEFQRTPGSGKILEFSSGCAAKKTHAGRQSWSEQAGVSDAERMMALLVGALLPPAVWAGHSLLVWMHLL